MLKVLLGIAIVAFSTFCGYLLSKGYRQRKLFFAQFYEFNERFLTEIAYYRRSLGDFLSSYTYQGEFDIVLKDFYVRLQDSKAVELSQWTFLKNEECIVIRDYFSMLGKGDSTSQKTYFSAIRDTLLRYQRVTSEEAKKYEDLYIKIGFLCGLFILILII